MAKTKVFVSGVALKKLFPYFCNPKWLRSSTE